MMYFYKTKLKLRKCWKNFVKNHIVDNDPFDMDISLSEEDINLKDTCCKDFEEDYENQPFGD